MMDSIVKYVMMPSYRDQDYLVLRCWIYTLEALGFCVLEGCFFPFLPYYMVSP